MASSVSQNDPKGSSHPGNEFQAPVDSMDLTSNSNTPGTMASNTMFSLQQIPLNFSLSSDDQESIFMNVRKVLDRTSTNDELMADTDDENEPKVNLEDQELRTQNLKDLTLPLAQLWWSGYQRMDLVTESLADASRDPRWRIPLGDSGTLDLYLQLLSTNALSHSLKIHTLRIIGNACADTNENRARVVASTLGPIIYQLSDTSLLPFTLPVLYNICLDYEPAQQQASALSLSQELISLISSPRFNESRAFLGYICRMLETLITHPLEVEKAPDNTAVVLLQIAIDKEYACDSEDFLLCTNTAIAYLQHDKFRRGLIAYGGLDTALTVLVDSYARFDSQPCEGQSAEDLSKLLANVRANLNQVLADVSFLPEFKEACPVVSPFTSSLRRWLSSSQLQLQVCACIMLGNLASSDAACEEFVHTSQIHKPLIEILKDASKSQVLAAAVGFLKNLALPSRNKEEIGNAGAFDVLPRLWHLDTLQQIQFDSISLTRSLVNGTFENVRKICKRLSEDPDSPANMRTKLTFLIALFDKTDVLPIKMEISRLVTAVCRVYNLFTEYTPEKMEQIRIKFFTLHPDVGRPLSFMVSQNKWPVVRSEGWFVFGLMSRYPEGAQCISDVLNDVAVFQPLVELLTGKDLIDAESSTLVASDPEANSPENLLAELQGQTVPSGTPTPHPQAEQMAMIDRENALILVSEMLKNRGSQMAVMRRTLFEDLLRGGGELILSYKESQPDWDIGALVANQDRVRSGLNIQEAAVESFKEMMQ